jgi:hypothetical protein
MISDLEELDVPGQRVVIEVDGDFYDIDSFEVDDDGDLVIKVGDYL